MNVSVLTGVRPRPEADDAGAASIQTVIVYPIVLLLIFGMVQGVLYFHAQNTAQAIANGAVQAARVEGGSVEAGYQEAAARLERAGEGVFADVRIAVDRGATTATATVTGLAPSIVPGLRGLLIEQTATGPVERFTSEGAP
ncbi:pilus assembly protein [Antribacter sp. KLBMP9083]|uniref:Pilus assembly protein n=1 Tax=Antribacter soli TaxID=2910976 RepID=A0AA41QBI2_9MICO|nr:TadE family protein [Antribacter soli]MCF4120408.1 pilus assembly protein [Antribacter soli]